MNEISIGLDLGTSGLKALALDTQGRTVAETTAHYPLHTPQPGWTEQDPHDWLVAAKTTLRDLHHQLGGTHRVLAIGLSGQMHGMVALDKAGQVVRRAPLWNDQRTGEACALIEATIPRPELVARTGNVAVTGFQLPKLLWLRQAEPEAFARTQLVLLPKDYLAFAMTGRATTEPSDASGTGALNIATKDWDDGVLQALGLTRQLFPEVIPSHAVVGGLSAAFALETGWPAGTPVVAGAGDNAGAAIGLGLSQSRMPLGSVSLGTSGVIFAPLATPTPDPQGRVHLFCHADGGYHLLGVTLAAAGSLQWLRDKLAPTTAFETLMQEAAEVPAGADGLTFMPYLAGERSPHLDPNLRAAWLGLSLAHGRGHMVRALLEGVAFSLRDTLEVIRPLAPQLTNLLSIGGGAQSELWLGTVASALGLPLLQSQVEEGPARGAAILGLVGAGVFDGVAQAIEKTAPHHAALSAQSINLEAAYSRYQNGFRAVKSMQQP